MIEDKQEETEEDINLEISISHFVESLDKNTKYIKCIECGAAVKKQQLLQNSYRNMFDYFIKCPVCKIYFSIKKE